MDGNKLIELALELGFADAAVIRTDELVFRSRISNAVRRKPMRKIRRELRLPARLRDGR